MTSYRQIYYHLVFNTKNRQRTIPDESSQELYKYIWGIIKNKGGKLYRINGSSEHLHLLCDLHPSMALADFVRDIKMSTSEWLKQNKNFPDFAGWGDGGAVFQ
jgi:REP element-mobilizing transposase RayT